MKPYPPAVRAEVMRLHATGEKGIKTIARETGIPQTTVRRWTRPALAERWRETARERKLRYRGECRVCGGPTNGAAGPGRAGKICMTCLAAEQRVFTDEQEAAIRRRYEDERVGCPTLGAENGVSAATIEDAIKRQGGQLRPHRVGEMSTRLPVDELVRRYLAGESMEMIAESLDATGGSVRFQLVGAGVKLRTLQEANRLRWKRWPDRGRP